MILNLIFASICLATHDLNSVQLSQKQAIEIENFFRTNQVQEILNRAWESCEMSQLEMQEVSEEDRYIFHGFDFADAQVCVSAGLSKLPFSQICELHAEKHPFLDARSELQRQGRAIYGGNCHIANNYFEDFLSRPIAYYEINAHSEPCHSIKPIYVFELKLAAKRVFIDCHTLCDFFEMALDIIIDRKFVESLNVISSTPDRRNPDNCKWSANNIISELVRLFLVEKGIAIYDSQGYFDNQIFNMIIDLNSIESVTPMTQNNAKEFEKSLKKKPPLRFFFLDFFLGLRIFKPSHNYSMPSKPVSV